MGGKESQAVREFGYSPVTKSTFWFRGFLIGQEPAFEGLNRAEKIPDLRGKIPARAG
jgi:hypothetical protein